MVAIVIDDLGMDRRRTAEIMALRGPLTMSFLSYAGDLSRQTRRAREAGHELLVHVPMEPEHVRDDMGTNVLEVGLSEKELVRRIDWALQRFSGFVGINNHMGSRFTADRPGMTRLMRELKNRGLLFLDSRTTARSVAAELARDFAVPFAERRVFLDNDPAPAAVARQMQEAERIARRDGAVVVIGQPRDATIAALRQWLSRLEERGFVLAPLSAVVNRAQLRGRG
jgi:polysaccharide deacetylase 2 family uncharacterized protein YibQ